LKDQYRQSERVGERESMRERERARERESMRERERKREREYAREREREDLLIPWQKSVREKLFEAICIRSDVVT
jgi:hypothetical protein